MWLSDVSMQHEAFGPTPNWRDLYWVHTRVMRLFGPLGPEPRATGGVLYRVEPELGRVLVQSVALPDVVGLRVVDLDPFLASLRAGEPVALRTKLNIVKTVNRSDASGPRRTREAVAPHDVGPWVTSRLAGALDHVVITGLSISIEKQRGVPLVSATVDLHAGCADRDALADLVASGVGKAKSFGCGLLSLRRVGPARGVEPVEAHEEPSE